MRGAYHKGEFVLDNKTTMVTMVLRSSIFCAHADHTSCCSIEAEQRRWQAAMVSLLSAAVSPMQNRPSLAVNPCNVCLIEADGTTAKRLRDREISRLQSRSAFHKRSCLCSPEGQSRNRTVTSTHLAALLLVPSLATQ